MAKNLIKLAASIIVLGLAAVGVALFLIDPNNYKTLIQEKAQQSIGVHIEIEGDIAWSLLPIGFDLNGLSIFDRQGKLFTRIDSMQLAVDTFSLLTLKPRIEGVYASGAKIVLSKDKQGNNNWDNILYHAPANDTKPSTIPGAHSQTAAPLENSGGAVPMFIPAQHIHFRDIAIDYFDASTKKDVSISELELEVSHATIAKRFPLALSYKFSSDALSLSFAHELETGIEVSPDLQQVSLTDLINNVDAGGAFGRNREIKLSLTGDIEVSRLSQELVARNIQLSGAGLAIDTNFKLTTIDLYPHMKGTISVAPFALSSINQHLSLDLGINDNAFRSVTFQTPFEFKNNKVSLPTFDLRIDNSQFLGRLAYHIVNHTLDLNIKGDTLDVDNYLAAIDSSHGASLTQQQHARTVLGAINSPDSASINSTNPKTILPIEAMQKLNAEITFAQDHLQYSGLELDDIQLEARLTGQALAVELIKVRSFEGLFTANGSITLNTSPVWQFNGDLVGLNLEPALASYVSDLPVSAEGRLNGAFQLNAQGNSVSELLQSNHGSLNFDISEGALKNLNLDRYMCEGIALINKKTLSSDWEKGTSFRSLTSKNALLNGTLSTRSINIQTPSLQAYGTGNIELESSKFSYNLAVKPLGISSDHACAVNAKFTNLEIPLKCAGSLTSSDEAIDCRLDKQRITRLIEQLAKEEANRKVEKELDRGLEKQLGEYINKDSELGKQIKKSILGIFN